MIGTWLGEDFSEREEMEEGECSVEREESVLERDGRGRRKLRRGRWSFEVIARRREVAKDPKSSRSPIFGTKQKYN